MSQLRKRVHLFNCDNTYKLEPVEKLLDQFRIHVERVEKHSFRLIKMSEMVDKITTLEMNMAFFVVHAHESRLSINEDNAGIGYAKIYRALLQATGGNVIIVIGGDDNYKSDDEENREVISRWAKRKVISQFGEEYLDGRKSFIFSWNKQHRVIHEQALLHHFDPNKKGQKFGYRSPPTNQPSRLEPKWRANSTESENLSASKHSPQNDEAVFTIKTVKEKQASAHLTSFSNTETSSRKIVIDNKRHSSIETPSSVSGETKDMAILGCNGQRESMVDVQKLSDGTRSSLQLSDGTSVKSPADHTKSESSELHRFRGKIGQNTPQPVLATQLSVNPPPVVLLRGIARYGKIYDNLGDHQVRDPEFKIPNEMEERLLKKHSGTPVIGVKIIRYSDGNIECRAYPSFKPFSLDKEKLREPTEKLVLKTRIREGKVSFEDDDVQFKYSNLYIPQHIIDGFPQEENGKVVCIFLDSEENFRCVVKRKSAGEKVTEFAKDQFFLCFPSHF